MNPDHRASESRDRLIRDEMRFVLQGDERRFGRELRARLLGEGCNLPLSVAKPAFYEQMIAGLTLGLSEEQQRWLSEHLPDGPEAITHPVFHFVMRQLEGRLPDPGPTLARAAVDAVAALNAVWRLDADCFRGTGEAFEACLRNAAARLTRGSPTRPLSVQSFDSLRRRVQLALVVSLLKYVSDPGAFEAAFGQVSRCLRGIAGDPSLFGRVMSFFFERIPYAGHLASQTFWRTLQALENEDRNSIA